MNDQTSAKLHPRMAVLIVPFDREQKVKGVLRGLHVPVYQQCKGTGTAPSEILEVFGLGGTARTVILTLLPKARVRELFGEAERVMRFHERGGGVGFSVPITSAQEHILSMLRKNAEKTVSGQTQTEGDEANMKENTAYAVVAVSVKRGFSEDVVRAARAAGATGGTVIKGSRTCDAESADFLGSSLKDEQDFVVILTPKEKKADIMAAISQACGLTSEAHGMVLSLPVDEVCGL